MKLHVSISLSLKFMFSKKATKNYKIFTVDLTLTKLHYENKFTKLVSFGIN